MMTSQPDRKPETVVALLARLDTLAARVEAQDAQIARLTARVSSAAAHVTVDRRGATTGDEPVASRRDVLRYGAIALGAAAAGLAARPAEAADGDPVLLGVVNPCTLPTVVDTTGGTLSLEARTNQANSTAVSGRGIGLGAKGVAGTAAGNGSYGVYGTSNSPGGTGTLGFNNLATGSTYGVRGEVVSPAGFAVYGRNSAGGTAVLGEVPSTTNQNGIALYGLNNSSYAGPAQGAGGFGVYGLSANGHGLVGATAIAGGAAVVGATNGVVGAYAGAFYGSVAVSGSLTVFGAKSAAVPHPDGSHRRLYCLESPESWFEDFGTGRLECGRAEVTIDPDFAAMVDLSHYYVFLTERDTHQHLIVRNQTTAGFAVEADVEMAALKGKQDADLNGAFAWRVVAKRRDIKGDRLEMVTIPAEPILPSVPDIPTPTARHQR